jgi:hypothetical protein
MKTGSITLTLLAAFALMADVVLAREECEGE